MNEILIALAGGVASIVVGVLTYRRSKVVDATSAQSGIASNHRAGTAQIIEGLNALIDQLQEDNDNFRGDIKDLLERCEVVRIERDALKLEIARLRRKYGNDNDTPLPPTKEK